MKITAKRLKEIIMEEMKQLKEYTPDERHISRQVADQRRSRRNNRFSRARDAVPGNPALEREKKKAAKMRKDYSDPQARAMASDYLTPAEERAADREFEKGYDKQEDVIEVTAFEVFFKKLKDLGVDIPDETVEAALLAADMGGINPDLAENRKRKSKKQTKITAKRLKQIIMQEIKGLNEEGGLSQALAAPVLTGQDARDFSKEQEDFDTNINYLEGRGWIPPDEKDPTFQAAVQAVLDSGTPKSKETEEYAALSDIVRKANEPEIEEAERVVRNLHNIARETVANAVGYAAKRAGRKDHAALHQALNSK